LIEAVRCEALSASRPHFRGTAEGIIFEEVQFRRADRQLLAVPERRLTEHRIGLIGDNGSGKSTMLRLMNGLLLPTRGRVELAGLDTVRHRKDLPTKVGFLFQNPDHQLIFPTVAEEVAFGPTERGLPARQARQLAIALLERHGCAQWADRNVNELSGCQKQLVCILIGAAQSRAAALRVVRFRYPVRPGDTFRLRARLTLVERRPHFVQVDASCDLELSDGKRVLTSQRTDVFFD